MVTVSDTSRSSDLDSSVDIETDTEYLKLAKKGGGHSGKSEFTRQTNYRVSAITRVDCTGKYTYQGKQIRQLCFLLSDAGIFVKCVILL